MTNRQLNEKIRKAYQNAAPDRWDAVLSDCVDKKGRVITMTTEKKRKKSMAKLIGLAACLCLLLGCGFGIRSYHADHVVDSTVSLDVNPSVEIRVNRKERVLDVSALNRDGEIIIGNMDLSGSDLRVAVNALIGSMLQNGYLNELTNSILISVDNNDPARGAALQGQLTEEVNKLLQTDTFSGSVLSQTVVKDDGLRQTADQYGITLGKAQLIRDILDSNSLHTFDELAPMTINELNLLLGKEPAAAAHVEVVGTASQKGYIGEDRAKAIALKKAGLSADGLTSYEIELDTHKGIMVYDVEFTAGGFEFDCEISASTGEIVKFEKEYDDDEPSVSVPKQNGVTEAGEITLEKAKEIALNHAGVKAVDAIELEVKPDQKDGRSVYEIEFKSGGYEYEYEIDTATGTILEFDKDWDD